MIRTQAQLRTWELVMWIVIGLLATALVISVVTTAGGTDLKQPPMERYLYVFSPINGVFMASEYSGGRPFVAIGSVVEPTTVVCRIVGSEVIDVQAQLAGTIEEVLVEDMQPVAAGQLLFRVKLHPEMLNSR